MRRVFLTAAIAASAALGLLTVPPVVAAHAAAAVVNPDFNESGGTTSPPGWATSSPDGTAAASYTEATSNGYGGDAYQLTHWSTAAFDVNTYQTLTGLSNGYYTLGVWTRSNGGDARDEITLTDCGGHPAPTAVPANSDGAWVQIVTYVRVTTGRCTINLVTRGNAGDWTNFDGVTFTPGTRPRLPPGRRTRSRSWKRRCMPIPSRWSPSKQVVADLVRQGTPPAMVQVGNEINGGMLWPTGSTSDFAQLAAQFKKPVFVAETAYPFTLTSNDPTASLSFSTASELDPGYPATPAGQAANFRDVLSVVQAVPNGLGLGAFYWEPTWTVVAGNGWDPTNPSSGDGWENQAMWNYSDAALPVIADFASR